MKPFKERLQQSHEDVKLRTTPEIEPENSPQLIPEQADVKPSAILKPASQANAPQTEKSSQLRKQWISAIFTFFAVNLCLQLLHTVTTLVGVQGIDAWFKLIQFNVQALQSFFIYGVAYGWQHIGPHKVFYLTLVAYWSLFIAFPVVIYGRVQPLWKKLLHLFAVWFGLLLFLPIPCFGLSYFACNYKSRFQALSRLERIPYAIRTACEWTFLFQVLWIFRYFLSRGHGPFAVDSLDFILLWEGLVFLILYVDVEDLVSYCGNKFSAGLPTKYR